MGEYGTVHDTWLCLSRFVSFVVSSLFLSSWTIYSTVNMVRGSVNRYPFFDVLIISRLASSRLVSSRLVSSRDHHIVMNYEMVHIFTSPSTYSIWHHTKKGPRQTILSYLFYSKFSRKLNFDTYRSLLKYLLFLKFGLWCDVMWLIWTCDVTTSGYGVR